MNREGYRGFLEKRNLGVDAIEEALAIVEAFEQHVCARGRMIRAADAEDVATFSKRLVAEGKNTVDHYHALLSYSAYAALPMLHTATIELLDGAEVLRNLHAKLADEVGAARRDELFEGVSVPPLGTPNEEKPALLQNILARLQAAEPRACARILARGLRDLKDEWYEDAKTDYASCSGLDEYLSARSERFIEELTRHRDEGRRWFVQEIDDDVIDYIRRHPEISGGVRYGSILYEAKIPYRTKAWMRESDPRLRRYFYCHCPWVRESLRASDVLVSPTFCTCGAALHKKRWEVIFGVSLHADVVESILRGDYRCVFAIHLPRGAR